MEVNEIRENEDGSAEFEFTMDEVEHEMLFEAGLRAISADPEEFCVEHHKSAKEAVIRLGVMTGIALGIQYAQEAKASTTS